MSTEEKSLNFIEQKTATKTSTVKTGNTEKIQLSDEQKKKLLDEVEKQQTEFGEKKLWMQNQCRLDKTSPQPSPEERDLRVILSLL